MRIVNHLIKAISFVFVKVNSLLVLIRFSSVHSFSIIKRSKRVHLDMPSLREQLSESSLSFFNSYSSPILKIYNCPNTFISPLGVISSNGLVLPYNLPIENRAQAIIIASGYKKLLFRTYPSQFNKGSYALFFNPFSYSNICHWLTEALVRIWLSKDILKKNDRFLIPNSSMNKFAIDSIRALGFDNDCVIHDSPRTIFQELKVISSYGRQSAFDLCIPEIRKTILGNTNLPIISASPFSVLYIKRHEKSLRKILNEDELLQSLSSQYKVKVIDPSELSFLQQVNEFSSAKCVISMHGAALTNIIWMREGSHVIELYKNLQSYIGNIYEPPNSPSPFYSRLSAVMKLNYYLFQCVSPESQIAFSHSGLIVDCISLKKLMKKIFKKSS